MSSIYTRIVPIPSSHTSTPANQKSKAEESKDGNKNGNNPAETTINKKLRGVARKDFYSKEEEKESYKILSQIEYNSFREQAELCTKKNQSMQYEDDGYYEEDQNQPQAAYESNQKSFMVFLVHSHDMIYRSEQLRALDSESIPDLEAFQKLGFPLKQTIKVSPIVKNGSSKEQQPKKAAG